METSTKSIKEKLDLDPKKIAALVITFVAALILTLFGWTANCFGMFLIGIGLYMVPHLMGVSNIKLLTVYGALFIVVAVLIGANVMAPAIINNNSEVPTDDDIFHEIVYEVEDDQIIITAWVYGELNGHNAIVNYCTIIAVGYSLKQTVSEKQTEMPMTATYDSVNGKTTLSANIQNDDSKLHLAMLGLSKTDDKGDKVFDSSTQTSGWFMIDAFNGSLSGLYYYGTFMSTLYTMILFFMVLYLSAFMRMRFKKVRSKMEAEGRLYPQGYGVCKECGHVVLPGEVNCRKCGAYIDRPEEMKPQKADFFTCSDCGAEVPGDAVVCPKCGAKFDDDVETEVVHADGSIDKTEKNVICPRCNTEIPAAASFCPKCGEKFKKD